uniref:dolichyl-diphosphooligosaccharide--protein glycotransferase n=2 Tax=Spongospora subterranea TaxID=70186 RepID=A0A0H5R5M2_9EUKA|eukprot:CRZ09433.1 hypothetical protein [Spongospora subterranea]
MAKLANFSGKNEFVFQALILACIYVLAFCVRLFSVLRHESVIHEFDPWFNFRTTKYLVSEGFYEFHNWFDEMSWYPYGRYIGGTIYPGLMWTAAVLYKILHYLNLPVDIRNVCVLLAPFMASNTSIVTYLLTKQVWTRAAGLVAAAFMAIAPGYISRSVAGSYDNEAVAIFALVCTFWLWLIAVDTGSLLWSAACALAYGYMVAAWGGYVFVWNIIAVHAFALVICGRYSPRLYVAYCTWYILGLLISMQIMFVGFQPVSTSSPEHVPAAGVFCLLQVYAFLNFVHSRVSRAQFRSILKMIGATVAISIVGVIGLALTGTVPFLTGRLKSLMGATTNIAIVKSVSEHQPTKWLTFFLDLHMMVALVPAGIYYVFWSVSDTNLFLILYMLFSAYFASIMIRLMLVISPIVCVLAGIGVSETLLTFCHILTMPSSLSDSSPSKNTSETVVLGRPYQGTQEEQRDWYRKYHVKKVAAPICIGVLLIFVVMFFFFVPHCTWMSANMYSSPQVVLSAKGRDGSLTIFDDFRESYQWLNHNTEPDAQILSWWDYGYQITGMGNRSVIVDNNTRNNTHIATVGLVMSSDEDRAIEIIRSLDVKYLLVVFGGMVGFSSDDINKFLWMVRISGGVYPEVVESEYFNRNGEFRVDESVSDRMKNSLMYSMCYYRFGEIRSSWDSQGGYDRVRNCHIGHKDIKFRYLEEAFTSEHWMVRIYRVKPRENL